MITQAVVLAGGFGTRLQTVVQDVPKPMALINNRPFLDYQLQYLKSFGIQHIIFSVGYLHEQISDFFGSEYQGMKIEYAIENEPLGTGGGIKKAFSFIHDGAAFVVNGDTLFEVDLKDLEAKHSQKKAIISLALRDVGDISRYGSVEYNSENQITGFSEKGKKTGQGFINGGIYIIEKEFFNRVTFPQKFSMEKDGFEKYFGSLKLCGFHYQSYFLDIGIPEDYKKAQDEFKNLGY